MQRPYRMALAHLWAAGMTWDAGPAAGAGLPGRRTTRSCATSSRPVWGVCPTSSMGRLFDAVSSLAGVRQTVALRGAGRHRTRRAFRAEPTCGARRIEFAVDRSGPGGRSIRRPVLAAVIADVRAGVPAGVIGARFHDAVADLVVAPGRPARGPDATVALSGGVFQNALLLRPTTALLREDGFTVLTHRRCRPTTVASRSAKCWSGTAA